MRFRKLRIAWSVTWGLAAVLLCVLWVRSYWKSDCLWTSHVGICSATGVAQLSVRSTPTNYRGRQWTTLPTRKDIFISPRFAFRPASNMSYINVTYWFLILILTTLAAVPWIRRFSLRTLLIATTLVAVVLGLIVWAAK